MMTGVKKENMAGIYRERAAKAMEQAVNIAIIVLAVVLAGMFIRNYLPAKSNVRQTISIGNRLDVQPVNWGSSSKNIVLVLSTTCKYCKASAGFYQRLARECEDRHIRTIALFPQTVEQSRAYLESEGVRVTEIWQAEPGKLKVQGTPTVLLVDNNCVVQHVWTGKLPANQEKDLLATTECLKISWACVLFSSTMEYLSNERTFPETFAPFSRCTVICFPPASATLRNDS